MILVLITQAEAELDNHIHILCKLSIGDDWMDGDIILKLELQHVNLNTEKL